MGSILASIMVKECLFRATLRVGEEVGSQLAVATAWHHRGDAMASGVALASQVASSLLGMHCWDAVGGSVVASMLAHSAWESILVSLDDVLDYNTALEARSSSPCSAEKLGSSIAGVANVHNHTLRTRRMGPYCLVDVTIVVGARLSASAASMVAEVVHDRVIRGFRPFVTDVLVHVDPEGTPQSHNLDTHEEDALEDLSKLQPADLEERVRVAILAQAGGAPSGRAPPILEVTDLQTYYHWPTGEGSGTSRTPRVSVKADIRLPGVGTTMAMARRVAHSARKRVLEDLGPDLVQEVDIDLELDEELLDHSGLDVCAAHGPRAC